MRPNDGRVVSNFVVQAILGKPLTVYGTGTQTRSFCYVDDLIEGIYRLLISEEHEPVNIGNPEEITIEDFAKVIDKQVGNASGLVYAKQERSPGDPQRRQPDISRAEKVLDWHPKISLEEGLGKTADYFRQELGM